VALAFDGGNVTISTYLAEALLRQFMARSELLAPLGSAAETCWQIILRIYVAKEAQDSTLETLANHMNMPVEHIRRYVELLGDVGFVQFQQTGTQYRLGQKLHDAVDDILHGTVQDLLSSLGR
jgi:predicted transcriptional regulator